MLWIILGMPAPTGWHPWSSRQQNCSTRSRPRDRSESSGLAWAGRLGLWASVRLTDLVAAAVSFYGSQQIDFAGSRSSYLIHLADVDEFITEDEMAFMEATMRLESLSVEVVRYSGTLHGFCEPDGDNFDPEAFEQAWAATLDFLAAQLAD